MPFVHHVIHNICGKTVIISHGGGFYTIYGQLDDILVKVKGKVSVSQSVGEIGGSGDNILYFEIRADNEPLNPLEWLKKK